MSAPRVAIIGAGLAGLTAAWKLSKHNIQAVVYESAPEIGGRTKTFSKYGATYDLGAWTFVAGGAVHELSKAMGLEESLASIETSVGRPYNNELRIGRLKQPWTFLGSVLTWQEIPQMLRLQLHARTLPGKTADELASLWASRSFSKQFCTHILAPIANLFFLQELGSLSRDQLLGTIRYLGSIQLHTMQQGMGQLTQELRNRIGEQTEFRTGTPVFSVEAKQRVTVTTQGNSEQFDACIMATDLPTALKIVDPELLSPVRPTAQAWEYAPIVQAHFLVRSEFEDQALMVLPPHNASGFAAGMTMERAKSPARAARGSEPLTMYARPEHSAELLSFPESRLKELFAAELYSWMGIPKARIEEIWITKWPRAVAHSDADAPPRQNLINAGLAEISSQKGIWFAGDYPVASSLEGAVKSGAKAAENCIQGLRA